MNYIKRIISLFLVAFVVLSLGAFSTALAQGETVQAGEVTLTSGRLNVRKTASVKSEILTTFKSGRNVTLVLKTGEWYKVEYKSGKYGYCHQDYIKKVQSTPARVNITSGHLNVRKKASLSAEIKAKLKKDTDVLVLKSGTKWAKILYNGSFRGYVRKEYLSLEQNSSSLPNIALSVPDFKQTDSRWANVKIGSSGKTIGQIGCATTAIAMMQSYRTGSTIYPDAMAKKLSYSSNGNVYWPSDYTVVTTDSGYLQGIYDRLSQNKPVLFGAKKSNGSQHWVVITGVKGNGTSASDFTINDPGSSSRKTLQQLLDSYPNFYKYFYY